MLKKSIIMIILLGLFSCEKNLDLPTVNTLDINRYLGTWYEIARLPNSFEKGLDCVTATYSLKENGKIKVVNRGRKFKEGEWSEANGTAWIPDAAYPGRLKVRFFWPFSGNYYVIALDDDYSLALVGDPSRKYLWILSRDKDVSEVIIEKLLAEARSQGFDTEDMIKVNQACDEE